jgi:O-antigen ligase
VNIYYLLLWFSRFHFDPRLGVTLFSAGPLLVTPIKLVGFLAVLVATLSTHQDNAASRLRDPIAWIFPVYGVLPVITTLTAGLPTPSEPISSLLSFYLMLVATRLLVITDERVIKTVRVLTLSSALGALWIFKQYFIQHMDRPTGLEQDPNYEALTLLTSLPFAIWMARREAGVWYRRAGALFAAILGAGVLITQSRGGIIALAVMALVSLIYSRRKAVTLALLAAVAMLSVTLAPGGLAQRFHSFRVQGNATNGDEESTRVHVELVKAGLAMIEAHPIFGIGLERFKAEAVKYNSGVYSVAGRAYIAHDTYIQIAAEEGLPMLLLFLVMIGSAFRNLAAVRRYAGQPLGDLAGAMQVGLVGFCIAAVSVTAEYIFPFWIIVFLSHNLREIAGAAQEVPVPARQPALDVTPVRSPSFSSRPGRPTPGRLSRTMPSCSTGARTGASRC